MLLYVKKKNNKDTYENTQSPCETYVSSQVSPFEIPNVMRELKC